MREYTFAQKLHTMTRTVVLVLTLAFAASPRLYAQHSEIACALAP